MKLMCNRKLYQQLMFYLSSLMDDNDLKHDTSTYKVQKYPVHIQVNLILALLVSLFVGGWISSLTTSALITEKHFTSLSKISTPEIEVKVKCLKQKS